jgi:RNA polymerase sigma-70 factor (ECF subfamily)
VAEAVIFNSQGRLMMNHIQTSVFVADADASAIFEEVFKTHFNSLHRYAMAILKDEIAAEEMVQNVFCRLWEKRELVEVHQSIKSYLYRAVHNECISYMRRNKVKEKYFKYLSANNSELQEATDRASYNELQLRVQAALGKLPGQCHTIFHLSRFEEMNYKQIADTLGITVSTVKNQMNKALKILREQLAGYLPILLYILINLKNYYL